MKLTSYESAMGKVNRIHSLDEMKSISEGTIIPGVLSRGAVVNQVFRSDLCANAPSFAEAFVYRPLKEGDKDISEFFEAYPVESGCVQIEFMSFQCPQENLSFSEEGLVILPLDKRKFVSYSPMHSIPLGAPYGESKEIFDRNLKDPNYRAVRKLFRDIGHKFLYGFTF